MKKIFTTDDRHNGILLLLKKQSGLSESVIIQFSIDLLIDRFNSISIEQLEYELNNYYKSYILKKRYDNNLYYHRGKNKGKSKLISEVIL